VIEEYEDLAPGTDLTANKAPAWLVLNGEEAGKAPLGDLM